MTQYIIVDWASNQMFADLRFKTFEDGWDYIYGCQGLTEDDYQDIYVVRYDEFKSRTHFE